MLVNSAVQDWKRLVKIVLINRMDSKVIQRKTEVVPKAETLGQVTAW